jgi:hypothetical protein
VAGRLSSHRFRRRLLWTLGPLTVVAGVVAAAIAIGNTGRSDQTPIDTTKKAWVYHAPKAMHLSPRDRNALMDLSVRFIRTAVARKQLDYAWTLAGPELRQGQSRKEWDSGFNAVVPFPASGIAAWDVLYTYHDDVAFEISLLGAKNQPWLSKTFTIELKRYPTRTDPNHWLVASWQPRGIGTYNSLRPADRPKLVPLEDHAELPRWSLIIPLAIFGSMVAGFALFGGVSYVRGRRSARRLAAALGHTSRTRPS